jgi:hypothetical protein
MTTDRDAFERHLENASRVVATWPRWKQTILGGNPIMMTTDQIKHARALLAGIKKKMEEGTQGKATADDGSYVWVDDSMIADTSCGSTATALDLANARLIAATHNGFPAALGDIEKDLELANAMILGGSYWEKTAQGFISRKLALLETLAREFGVEVGE